MDNATERSEVNFQEEKWTKGGFNLHETIQQTTSPLVELGGPTPQGYELVDFDNFPDKQILIINIDPQTVKRDLDNRNYSISPEKKRVDLQADATKLPFEDQSIGVLFASALPIDIHADIFRDAVRVLSPGGIMVWEGGREEDINLAKNNGLELVQSNKTIYDEDYILALVFQKPLEGL